MATASVSPSRPGSAAPFMMTAADGSPLPIAPGDYYPTPKAQTDRTMKSSTLSVNARRVYDCLKHATMAYRQELAVVMENGQERHFTPADIARKTRMTFQAVRGALDELENEGLAQRVAADGGKLRKGQVLIYLWAFPRESKRKQVSGPREIQSSLPDGLSESVVSLIKRLRLKVDVSQIVVTRELNEELEEDARIIAEAQIRFARKLKSSPAKPSLYKEERKERNTERTEESVSPSLVEYGEPEEPRPTDGPALCTEPVEPEPIGDVAPVIAAVRQYHSIDLTTKDAVDMVEHCREEQRDPAISPAEVARFVSTVDPIRSNSTIKHPRRFLRTAVARKITRQDLAVLRNHSTPRVPVACDSAFDDPEVESIRCHRCGGLTIHYLSGRVSPCPCGSGPPGRIQ